MKNLKQRIQLVLALGIASCSTEKKPEAQAPQNMEQTMAATSSETAVQVTSFANSSSKASRTQTMWLTNSNGKKVSKEMYKEFDGRNQVTKRVQFVDGSEICDAYAYQYERNRLKEVTTSHCNTQNSTKKVLHYDSRNRLLREDSIDEKGILEEQAFYRYHAQDTLAYQVDHKITEEEGFYLTDALEYYPNGLLKKKTQYAGGWFGTWTYKYDKTGNQIYESAEVDGGVGLVEYFYIFENNLLVRDSVLIPDEGKKYHLYEYK
ncbi:MAG: hypothetical protein ACO1OQ_15230 [Rufibacter sp.]